ncbi:MAG: sensor histidine kinase [Chloroflexota bacterium]
MRPIWVNMDSDALLSRLLTGLLMAGYAALVYVVTIGAFNLAPLTDVRDDFSPPWWQNALAIVALTLTARPVYLRVRAGVRAVIFSHPGEPFPALAQLDQRIETAPSPHTILPEIAASLAQILRLPYVRIEALPPNPSAGSRAAAEAQPLAGEYGRPPAGADLIQTGLNYQQAAIGALYVAPRRPGEPLTGDEMRRLNDLARHVGVALYAARLGDDLQHARERLVIAREEERRRIRNDLHDGLAPTLSSLQLQLGLLWNLIQKDPGQAQEMIAEMRSDLQDATGEIRRLVYDLRPPMLDELGLAGALQNIKFPDPAACFEVHVQAGLPRLSAALEVAVYRIAGEAVHNVLKHAQAKTCVLTVSVDAGRLTLSVSDDGQASLEDRQAGVGLNSMQERAAELGGTLLVQGCEGGGTCGTAVFPLDP